MVDDGLDRRSTVVRALVVEWVRLTGAGPVDVDSEVSAWLTLDEAQRALVAERLAAFVRLHASGRRGDVAAVAVKLELGRANVYRLLKRMEEVGPVSGLVAHKRARGVRSPVRDGFGAPWDELILRVLALRPDVAVPTLRNEIASLAIEEGHSGSAPPEVTALRRRVNRIRASASARGDRTEGVGADLLVDLAALDAVVLPSEGEPAREVLLMVLLDVGSNLVIGHSLIDEDQRDAFIRCIVSSGATLSGLAKSGAPIAGAMRAVRIVPPGAMSSEASWIGATLPADRRPQIDLSKGPLLFYGRTLVRRIGDRLGGFRVYPTMQSSPRSVEIGRAGTAPVFVNLADAEYAIGMAIADWNARRLSGMTLTGNRAHKGAADRAARLAEELVASILPVVDRWHAPPTKHKGFTRRRGSEG